MQQNNFVWKVAGAAGEGIMTTGLLLSKTIARHGWYIFDYPEYPSLIRGGHNDYQIHASKNPVFAQSTKVDLLVALNKDGLDFHKDELVDTSIVLYDGSDDNINIASYNLKAKAIDLPMVKLAEESGGKDVMSNNVALGASIYLLGLNLTVLDQLITDVFSDKGQEIIMLNQKAAAAGYNFLQKSAVQPLLKVEAQPENKLLTATGNEAIALGALAGGLKFYAAYPMTPSSSILHFLAEKAKDAKIVVKHAEDEISAANMALGASFAGARSMVGTSGGGFCYMTEALGLAGISELPIVFINAMRPGPALGLPTWTAQGDLKFVISASQDEFPRIVLAPSDAQEAFELSRKAQELAEKYQIPIIILSDKYLSESRYWMKLGATVFNNTRQGFNLSPSLDNTGFFPRYQDTETGVSQRPIPSTPNGNFINNSYTHNQYGFSSEESKTRKEGTDKLFKKFERIKSEIPGQFWEFEQGANITFISLGSTKGPLLEAQKKLKLENLPINILNLSWLWPFPIDQVKEAISSSKNVVIAEGNSQGQLADLISQQTGMIIKNRLNRYDGRPFYPEDIMEFVKNFKPLL